LACLPLRSIKSLELKNFMTHSHLILRPSARGNLIIGPNGSGKSSVVCAIILGLGGSIRTMDRATDLSGFVKRVHARQHPPSAVLSDAQLHLHDAHTGGDTVIRRTIDTDRKSSFFMGKAAVALASVTKQKVQETVQQLGIFVDNNCQVLPQEAISKF
ncbi:SMC5, partial [Symbiodinium sp. KB8]